MNKLNLKRKGLVFLLLLFSIYTLTKGYVEKKNIKIILSIISCIGFISLIIFSSNKNNKKQ